MKSIIAALTGQGVDPSKVILSATVRNLHCTTYEGKVAVRPFATSIDFLSSETSDVLCTLECHGQDCLDENAYWLDAKIPDGFALEDCKILAEGFVEEYTALSGDRLGFYKATNDAESICDLKLTLDLMLLVKSIELLSQMFSYVDDEDSKQNFYERISLRAEFREVPCSREQFDALMEIYLGPSRNWAAVGLPHFYTWFLESKTMFNDEQTRFSEKALPIVESAIAAYADKLPAALETLRIVLARSARIHPIHKLQFESALDGVLKEEASSNIERENQRPRG